MSEIEAEEALSEMTGGFHRLGATGLSGLGVFRGCPVIVPRGSIREAAKLICACFSDLPCAPAPPARECRPFQGLIRTAPVPARCQEKGATGRGFTGQARSAS